MSCNSPIQKKHVDLLLKNGGKLEDIECPNCNRKCVYFRGPNMSKHQAESKMWIGEIWKTSKHQSVSVRKIRKKVISGFQHNGMPVVERGDSVYLWVFDRVKEVCKWEAVGYSRHAYMANYQYTRKHAIGDWTFCITSKRKHADCVEFEAKFSGENDRQISDFSTVIAEAGKFGFNATAEFLSEQVKNIREGFKQNRFLPDGSGEVFSPIRDNGIIFRFQKITDKSTEYIA